MTGQHVQDSPSAPGQLYSAADDTTRHLAAAVHVDDGFADTVIKEFLVEPRRAIPPSPGLDPVVVLAEAVAARRRRVFRDIVVIGLFVAVLVLGWPFSLVWLLIAVAGMLANNFFRNSWRGRRIAGRSAGGAWLLVLLVVVAIGALSWLAVSYFAGGGTPSDAYYYDEGARPPGGGTSTSTVVSIILLVLVVVVVVADRAYVHSLLRSRFSRRAWTSQQGWANGYPVPAPPQSAWYTKRLMTIGRSGGQSNAHVHYRYKAFVGSGTRTHGWTVVTRLRPASPDTQAEPITPTDIYRAVIDEVMTMRDYTSLAPGNRLITLQQNTELITSANSLLYYSDNPISQAILPDRSEAPRNVIDPRIIDQMLDRSPEWARPYLSFRIDGWARELVVSTYLHVGCENDMLYLEWAAYQLNPIRPDYRVEWMALNHPPMVMITALLDALTVPTSLPVRIRTLWRAARDASGATPSTDLYDPARSYGVDRSIREIAADDNTSTYFEDVDGVRYLRLLEHRTLTAVANVLQAKGLATQEFREQSTTIINSTVISGGTVTAGNIGGTGNRVRTDSVKTDASTSQQPRRESGD
jgi:hypothetical protein